MSTEPKVARFPGTDRKVNAAVLAAARAARKPGTHLEIESFDVVRVVNNNNCRCAPKAASTAAPRPRVA